MVEQRTLTPLVLVRVQVPQPLQKPLIFNGFFVSQSSSKSPVNQFSYYFLTIFLIFRNEKIKSLIKISSFSLSGIREKWEKRESKNPCPAAFLILLFLLWNGNFRKSWKTRFGHKEKAHPFGHAFVCF